MNQEDVANLLGCTVQSIRFWEHNRTKPIHKYMPKVIEFLGYDPFPQPTTLGERLIRYRLILGLTQRELARKLRVSPDALITWERGLHKPTARSLRAIAGIIGAQW